MSEGHKTILTLYRQLLKTARNLKGSEKQASMTQIRDSFRSSKDISDQNRVRELLEMAQSKLGYLKIVTPKTKLVGGTSSFVMRKGNLQKGRGSVGGKTQKSDGDTDILAKHKYLMERQHFMHRK